MMEIRIFKCKDKGMSWGILNDKWLPSHVIVPIPLNKKFVSVTDGQVGFVQVIDKETGEPVPALDLVETFLVQNKSSQHVDQFGAKNINYYDKEFFIDYTPDLKEFFEKNKLPIPADGQSVGERMLGGLKKSLASFGLQQSDEPEAALSPGQKAVIEAKKTKSKKTDKIEE